MKPEFELVVASELSLDGDMTMEGCLKVVRLRCSGIVVCVCCDETTVDLFVVITDGSSTDPSSMLLIGERDFVFLPRFSFGTAYILGS